MNVIPPGLADLRNDAIAKAAGLSEKWITRLLRNPLSNNATCAEWRAHFLAMKARYDREQHSAA